MRTNRTTGDGPRMLVVDPTGGLSGDMFLACLFALGVSPREVERELAKLPGLEPFRIVTGRVKRRGIAMWRARVRCSPAGGPRDLSSILSMIDRSKLEAGVKDLASAVFSAIGRAEGSIHGVKPDRIHFHEVGAVDSIVDIVGAVVALSMLRFPVLYHRPFRLGSGTVPIAHGEFPVPAPATLALLEGRTVTLGGAEGEMVTPTGAALMRVLAEELPPTRSFVPCRTVYAAGTREKAAGYLRVIEARPVDARGEIDVLRTTIDDMNPQLYGQLTDLLFAAGALEVYLTQVVMKKGRPGVLVTVLCGPDDRDRLVSLLLSETTTLGVRIAVETREELDRWIEAVNTSYGRVEVKFGRLPGGAVKSAPEYESCRRLAASRGVPIAAVYRAACAAADGIALRRGRAAAGGRGGAAPSPRGAKRRPERGRAARRRGRGARR